MKKPLLFVAISSAALLTLATTGCSKKDSGSGSYTMTSLAGSYKLTTATITVAGASFNYLDALEDCQKDDILTLNADSTAVSTDAGVSCGNGNTTGKWYVSGNYLIQIDDQQQKDTATIKSFNGSALVLTITGDYLAVTGTVTSTFTKQ